jgi:hypothetical protein
MMRTKETISGAIVVGIVFVGVIIAASTPPATTSGTTSVTQAKMEDAVQETYEELMRRPQNHMRELVRARGKVIQVMRDGSNVQLRVEITHKTQTQYFDLWDDVVLVSYYQSPNETRILENDIVNFWGKSQGTITYKAIFGNTVEVPNITAYGITKEDAARSET